MRVGMICSVNGTVDCPEYVDGLCRLKRRLNLCERREACKRLRHCPKNDPDVRECERLRGVISKVRATLEDFRLEGAK